MAGVLSSSNLGPSHSMYPEASVPLGYRKKRGGVGRLDTNKLQPPSRYKDVLKREGCGHPCCQTIETVTPGELEFL